MDNSYCFACRQSLFFCHFRYFFFIFSTKAKGTLPMSRKVRVFFSVFVWWFNNLFLFFILLRCLWIAFPSLTCRLTFFFLRRITRKNYVLYFSPFEMEPEHEKSRQKTPFCYRCDKIKSRITRGKILNRLFFKNHFFFFKYLYNECARTNGKMYTFFILEWYLAFGRSQWCRRMRPTNAMYNLRVKWMRAQRRQDAVSARSRWMSVESKKKYKIKKNEEERKERIVNNTIFPVFITN